MREEVYSIDWFDSDTNSTDSLNDLKQVLFVVS